MRRQIFGDPKEGRLRGGRAKIRYGSFHFQIKTFDRDQMFYKSNSSEIVHSTFDIIMYEKRFQRRGFKLDH